MKRPSMVYELSGLDKSLLCSVSREKRKGEPRASALRLGWLAASAGHQTFLISFLPPTVHPPTAIKP